MIERIEINLLPAEYRFHKRTIHLQREVVYPVLVVVLLFIVLILWTIFQQNSISYYNGQIAFLDQEINQNRPIQAEINSLRTDKLTIQQKIRALERINVNREKWVKLMEELSSRLPEYTWLISIKEENTEMPLLSIEGRTYSFPEVANYMSNLKESPFVNAVDLTNIEQMGSKDKVYKFFITCTLNPDADLPKEDNGSVVLNESR